MEKINSFEEQEFGEKIVHIDKFHKVLGILWNFEIDELFFWFEKCCFWESDFSKTWILKSSVFCVWSFRRRLSDNRLI